MSTVRSFELKLKRAYEHLGTFQPEADVWIKTEPYGIIDEPDPEPPPKPVGDNGRPRRFRVNRVTDVPDRLSVILGDCLFNLRSALDHLAMALARSHSPAMSSNAVANSEFPIYGDAAGYTKHEVRKIGCVAPAARSIIEGLQPYQRRADVHEHPLWKIHDLNRIDKHRALTVCAALPMKDGTRCVGIPVDRIENMATTAYFLVAGSINLELDAVLVRWAGIPHDPNREVRMSPEIPLEIAFYHGAPGTGLQSAIPTLQALCDFVSNIAIPQLSKFL